MGLALTGCPDGADPEPDYGSPDIETGDTAQESEYGIADTGEARPGDPVLEPPSEPAEPSE